MAKLRHAFRSLLNTPLLTTVAVFSLALGIGVNGAIFSLFDQLLLRALPVAAPQELVNLGAPGPKPGSTSCNNAGDCNAVFSYPMFRDLEHQQTVFTSMAAHRLFGANLAFDGQTVSSEGLLVSGGYFPTLGLVPTLGRLLGPDDDAVVGEARVAVLSHDAWRNRFGARPDVLEKTMMVNGHPFTIVGVAPAGFRGTTLGSRPEVFVPITLRGLMEPAFNGFEERLNYWAYVFARRAPGVSVEAAETALRAPYAAILRDVEAPLQPSMSDATMQRFLARRITVAPGARGQSSVDEESRPALLMLFAVAGVVLLIACANVANLLLARAAARGGEMAVRLSIGASRGQLIGQLLTEALLLAALAGAAGLLVANWTLHGIAALLPPDALELLELGLNVRQLLFSAALALVTTLLFGLFPALHGTRPDLVTALKGEARQPAATRNTARWRQGLVVAQIALSTTLLVAAGLFTKSLANVSRIDLGLEVEHLVTFALSPELNGYRPEQTRALFERTEVELAALPGVSGVAASMVPLLAGSSWGSSLSVEGFVADLDTDTSARYNEIGPGYFRTLGIPLLAGRELTDADVLGAPKVAIVNEAFVEKFQLGTDVVGKRMTRGGGGDLDMVIVGLVKDAKYSEVKDTIPPLFFTPYRQDEQLGSIYFYVRTALAPETVLAAIPELVRRLDPNLPIEELKTMPQQVRENVFLDRFISVLSAAFAILATLLAAVGLYGVVAYNVAQRTREIGLRMALGADAARVRAMVLGQVGFLVLVGAPAGLVAAIALGQLARAQLYGLEGHDPLVLAGAAVALTLVALGAGLVPARRAARIDPMRALRDQ